MCWNIHGKFGTFQSFSFPATISLDFNMIYPINLQSCDCVVKLHPRYTFSSYSWYVWWNFFPKQPITVDWSICTNKSLVMYCIRENAQFNNLSYSGGNIFMLWFNPFPTDKIICPLTDTKRGCGWQSRERVRKDRLGDLALAIWG